jgi:glycine/D-amino acid oxidase-like deaminating enzyme
MDLESGAPLWPIQTGLRRSYPRLRGRLTTEVLIVGAGLTGALIADELTRAGRQVAVIDRRDVAAGSTSATTALLQYEMDVSLRQLQEWYGRDAGAALYRSGLDAINALERLCAPLPRQGGFHRRPSLYLASSQADRDELQAEYAARLAAELPVESWSETQIASLCSFTAPGALYSPVAAELDPYLVAQSVWERLSDQGVPVFDRTTVCGYETSGEGIRFETEQGEIRAWRAVIAAGYESESFLPRPLASLRSTFAFASEPVAAFPGWPDRCLIWETARPYLYLRTTPDNRILAGGEDTWFRNERIRDQMLPARIARIERRVRAMFPAIDVAVDYAWAGTFAETPDGLPFIGPHPERPGLLFAMCYGGSGVTFGVLAAEVLRACLENRSHPLSPYVAFERKSLGGV